MCTILTVIVFSLCTSVAFGQNCKGDMSDFTISPNEVVEPIDAVATISCLYKPSPGTIIQWGVVKSGVSSFVFNGTNIFISRDGGRKLIFSPVTTGQEGRYYCWIPLSSTEDRCSEQVQFTILRTPVITNKDKPSNMVSFDYNLTVRSPARLNFTTNGRPTPELILYKRTQPGGSYDVFNSERFEVTLVGIMISSVEPEDVGEYRLTATYETYHDSEEFTIAVTIPPVAPSLALEILNATATDDTRVLAHVGTFVSIACKMTEAYTEGNLQVHWSADSNINDVPTMKPSQTEVHLTLNNVDREDEGRYTCHAANNLGNTHISVNLVVGKVPEPYKITANSDNNTLIVVWEENTTQSNDEQILAHYVQYKSVNSSDMVIVVEKFAASVETTTFRSVERYVEYIVTMWSENAFGNSSISNSVSVVITGPPPTSSPPTTTSPQTSDSNEDNSSDAAVIGTVVGVCLLVAIVFCTVVILLLVLYLNNRRAQGQQQWQKDPEFQSQLSLSAGSVRVPHIPPSESMPPAVPTYATPFLNTMNGFSSSSISKRSSEDNNWQIPRDNIQLSELLAEGEHTVLYRATVFGIGKFKKTTEVTVKQVKDNNSSPEEVKVLIEEMDLMQDLGIHPNVVNILAVCTVGDPVYLIMDYFAHGDLLGFLRATRGHTEHYTVSAGTETKVPSCTVQPQDLLSLASQVANGMCFLEEKKVAHRSLCARNVLVGTGLQVKIYNYGQKNDDQSSYAKWMAPETLFDGTANATSDVWSFGVTLWEIVTIGGSPYFQMRPEDMRKVLEDGYRMPNPDHCSEEIYKIMQDCWEYDPQDRPGFDLISYRLETLSKSKLSYIDLKLYDEVLYSQFEDTPQLCTAL